MAYVVMLLHLVGQTCKTCGMARKGLLIGGGSLVAAGIIGGTVAAGLVGGGVGTPRVVQRSDAAVTTTTAAPAPTTTTTVAPVTTTTVDTSTMTADQAAASAQTSANSAAVSAGQAAQSASQAQQVVQSATTTTAPATVAVPAGTLGMGPNVASAILRNAGLVPLLGSTCQASSWVVAATSPPPGSPVPPGATVTIVCA